MTHSTIIRPTSTSLSSYQFSSSTTANICMTLSSSHIKQEEYESALSSMLYTFPPSRSSSPFSSVELKGNNDIASAMEQPIFSTPDYRREVPLAKSVRRIEGSFSPTARPTDLELISPANPCSPTLSSECPSSSQPRSATTTSPRIHIPRPPNAFMIYRSELIKNRSVPLDIEHRQQNLSRLAGQCWNLLSPEEKEVYHKKAAQVLREHQRLNPNYKFTPAPRGSRRSKAKGQTEPVSDDVERIKSIREQYVKVLGPSLVASRKRRRRQRDRSAETDKSDNSTPALEINPGLTFSGPSSPASPASPMSVIGDNPAFSFFLPSGLPYNNNSATLPRRPSTSLGFASYADGSNSFVNPFLNINRPPVATSNVAMSSLLQGLDIAGTGMPDTVTQPHYSFQSPPFNFDMFSFPTSIPPNFNSFLTQDGHELSPLSHSLSMEMSLPPSFQNNMSQLCQGGPLSMCRSPAEVSPLDTSGNCQPPLLPPFENWQIVHNPSDEINYALTSLEGTR